MTIKPGYVADANALYWYLIHDKKLSAKAREIFHAAERGETQIIISVIALAELYYIQQKKPMPQDFATIYEDLKSKPYFEFVAFHPGDVLDFAKDSPVPEMHDRIIAGLARRLDAPLITIDPMIAASGLVEIVW